MSILETPEVILVMVAIFLLLGGKKLPKLMREIERGEKAIDDPKGIAEAALRKRP